MTLTRAVGARRCRSGHDEAVLRLAGEVLDDDAAKLEQRLLGCAGPVVLRVVQG
jgi:hypothetical protein